MFKLSMIEQDIRDYKSGVFFKYKNND